MVLLAGVQPPPTPMGFLLQPVKVPAELDEDPARGLDGLWRRGVDPSAAT